MPAERRRAPPTAAERTKAPPPEKGASRAQEGSASGSRAHEGSATGRVPAERRRAPPAAAAERRRSAAKKKFKILKEPPGKTLEKEKITRSYTKPYSNLTPTRKVKRLNLNPEPYLKSRSSAALSGCGSTVESDRESSCGKRGLRREGAASQSPPSNPTPQTAEHSRTTPQPPKTKTVCPASSPRRRPGGRICKYLYIYTCRNIDIDIDLDIGIGIDIDIDIDIDI